MNNDNIYRCITPLYKYNNNSIIVLKTEIDINNNNWSYEVQDNNIVNIYIPFYNPDSTENSVLYKIEKEIDTFFTKLKKEGIFE